MISRRFGGQTAYGRSTKPRDPLGEGTRAGQRGEPATSNPYRVGSFERAQWINGHGAGQLTGRLRENTS